MRGRDHGGGARGRLPERRPGRVAAPRPRVAEPEGGQDVERRRLRPAVRDRDLDQQVLGGRLGVLDEHVEVPILVEHPRVEELVLEVVLPPAAVRLHQVAVRELRLRVLVEVLHVGVGRRRVEVEVVLLDVLAVVPLAVRQAEQPLLENGIPAVPQGEREAQELAVIGDPGQPVLAPAIGTRPRLVVAEVVPGVARVAVVLADRAPLALREIGTPLPPGHSLLPRRRQPFLLRCPGLTRHWRLLLRSPPPGVARFGLPRSRGRRPWTEPSHELLEFVSCGHGVRYLAPSTRLRRVVPRSRARL